MNLRSLHFGIGLLFATMPIALAEPPATNTPPGPQQLQESTAPEPASTAPPQPNAKSAPGAASPNGTNGTTPSGKPITKTPNTPRKKGQNPATPAPAVAAAPVKPAPPILDNYIKDLNTALALSPNEKTEIQGFYLTDAPVLNQILNDPALSPLQQAQHVSDLRDERNEKIGALLVDVDRRREFFQIEAGYRVALTDAAADGTLVPAAPPPAAPAPSDTAPGEATQIPTKNSGAK
jgi:hypothetical protein